MKSTIILLLSLVVGASSATTPKPAFTLAKLHYNGVPFKAKKEQILLRFGKPASVVNPNYECGFLAAADSKNPFYALRYAQVTFTGNAKEDYVLEEVIFSPNMKHPLMYGQQAITAKTTLQDLQRMFGSALISEKDSKGDVAAKVQGTDDDAAVFVFTAGKLTSYTYWSPC